MSRLTERLGDFAENMGPAEHALTAAALLTGAYAVLKFEASCYSSDDFQRMPSVLRGLVLPALCVMGAIYHAEEAAVSSDRSV